MKKKTGFTLAEVLITLAIIGIIAALVIPAVMTNFQFRNIGVRLAKFASTVENATRAFVVSDEALSGDGTDDSNAVIARYISQTFSYTNAGATLTPAVAGDPINADNIAALATAGAQETDADMKDFIEALNVGPTGRDQELQGNEVVLKDGTRAHFWLFNIDPTATDNEIWHGHTNPGRASIGMPAVGIIFDPLATIVPRTARRTFGFIVTSQGYVLPAGVDDCLYSIVDSRWETRQETFTEGVCADGTIGSD